MSGLEFRDHRATDRARAGHDPVGYAAAYRVFAESDVIGDLHRIRCPTLVMTGERNTGSPTAMAKDIPSASAPRASSSCRAIATAS
jgi:pimeloyl-ACP methyl ester carboxylesterase